MKIRWQLIIVIALTTAAFIPAVFGEFISIDDTGMIETLRSAPDRSLFDVFWGPNKRIGLYFRPILSMTFHLDKIWWSLNPLVMRFENALLHICSTVMIFAVLTALVRSPRGNMSLLPLVGGLWFGLHPLATESVAWVSGRTDLLAGFFIFVGTYALIRFKLGATRLFLFLLALSTMCGALSKEVAFFFPVCIVLLTTADVTGQQEGVGLRNYSVKLRNRSLVVLLLIAMVLVIVLFNKSISSHSDDRLGMTLKFIFNDPIHSLFVAFKVVGFYVKKIFIPWQLNFAIMEVDPLYDLLGILIVVLSVYLLSVKKINAAFFLSGIAFLGQSYPIAYNNIAWTPYAERYAYVSIWFVIVAIILSIDRFEISKIKNYIFATLMLLYLSVFFVSTWHRNTVWQTNLSLWEDTVEKSPENYVSLNEYANALYKNGNIDDSIKYFSKASSAFRIFYEVKYDINYAIAKEHSGDLDGAVDVYIKILKNTDNRSLVALKGVIGIFETMQKREKEIDKKNSLQHKIIYYKEKLYDMTGDAELLVSLGDDNLSIDKEMSQMYYTQAKLILNDKKKIDNLTKQISVLSVSNGNVKREK